MTRMHAAADIYLDNAATTKPCAAAVEATTRALADEYGNASSGHARGQAAKALLEESRAIIAQALDVDAREVYFTSGATEANNLAIRGAAEARGVDAGVIITSELEHPSVTRTVRGLRRAGFTTKHIPARGGNFEMDALRLELASATQLVTVMQVHNELGYVFPIAEIADAAHELAPGALVHTDATQAFGKLDVRPRALGVDLLSVSAHKLGGPKGIGALYVRKGTKMFTNAFGGGQERGLRSGTEPVFLIAGFAAAVQEVMQQREQHLEHVTKLRDELLAGLQAVFPQLIVNSRADGSPYIVSFALPGIDNRILVQRLSDQGIYVSSASACTHARYAGSAATAHDKHPLPMELAGIPDEISSATLRIGFAPSNTTQDIHVLLTALTSIVEDVQSGTSGDGADVVRAPIVGIGV